MHLIDSKASTYIVSMTVLITLISEYQVRGVSKYAVFSEGLYDKRGVQSVALSKFTALNV